jgi:hypothetical protein
VAYLCSARSGITRRARTDVVASILSAVGEWFANMSAFLSVSALTWKSGLWDRAHEEALESFGTILRT